MRPKIMFLITEDRFLWSHRLPIARAALQRGYEVVIITRVMGDAQKILDEGFRLIPLQLKRGSYNPLRDLRAILKLRRIYEQEKPAIVHHVALKPVLYGTIAALGLNDIRVVNALTGLGYLVASNTAKARLLRPAILSLLNFLLNRPNQCVLLQNDEDKHYLCTVLRVAPERIAIIRGSGVDIHLFKPSSEPEGVPIVLFASRMLWIKGIREFVEVAKVLRSKGTMARFVIVGDSDFGSPSSVPRERLNEWQKSREVECWGHRHDMSLVLSQASIVCLPSHGGEGVPKTLLEAAASGRAIVATDVPGCRDIVYQDVNGKLVEPKNVLALGAAIEELLKDRAKRQVMGERGREIAVGNFSEARVVGDTLNLYSELLKSALLPSFAAPRATGKI